MKQYKVIYADPPWAYNSKNVNGAIQAYNSMSLPDIESLPIPKISLDNAALFLWVTGPLLVEGLQVMDAWGFKYKTIAFTWVKLNRDLSPFFGVGAYTRSNAELCLLGIRGKIKRTDIHSNSETQVIVTMRSNSKQSMHSVKPDQAYERIEKLFGDVPRVELFARRKREGWDSWGNQVQCDFEFPKE